MAKRSHTVIFERGDRRGQWIAHVKELPQCHTFGRGLAQTRDRIREALVLWEGDAAESAKLQEVLPLPMQAKTLIARMRELSGKVQALHDERDHVVASMLDQHWSMRDVAHVFGLSHQRVNQVAGSKRRPRRRRADAGK